MFLSLAKNIQQSAVLLMCVMVFVIILCYVFLMHPSCGERNAYVPSHSLMSSSSNSLYSYIGLNVSKLIRFLSTTLSVCAGYSLFQKIVE